MPGIKPGMTASLLNSLPPHHLGAAHIGLQRGRNSDGAVFLLIGFHHGDERAADRGARAVERMHETRLAIRATIPRVHAARLEIAADGAGRNLTVHTALALTRHPHFDVVSLLR